MPGSLSKQKVAEVVRYKQVRIPLTKIYVKLKPLHQPLIIRRQAQHHGAEAINGGHSRIRMTHHPGDAMIIGDRRTGEPAQRQGQCARGDPQL